MTSSRRSEREVDVDVRVGRPALVDEPLEQQVVLDRLDPADPERVRHDRAGRAAPALGRDPLLLREAHQVPADQEELGEAGPLDDVELVGEPVDDRRGQRVVALPGARPAQLREVRERRLALRHREAREAVLLEPEVDRARRRELAERRDPLRPGAGDVAAERRRRPAAARASSRRRLQVRLAVGPAQVAERLERPAVADRGQDVLELAALGPGVVDVVRDDDRQAQLVGERRPSRSRASRRRAGGGATARDGSARGPVAARRAPRAAARAPSRSPTRSRRAISPSRQPDSATRPSVCSASERRGRTAARLRPGEVRPRDEPAQAPIAGRVPGEQDEMRAALPLADPAQVLLDRLAMARAAGPAPGAAEPAGPRGRGLARRRPAAPALRRPPRRTGRRAGHDDPVGSGDDRVAAARSRSRGPAGARPPRAALANRTTP